MSIEKRLLKLFREEVENFGLTPHIKRVLEDEEYAAKQGGDKPDVSVEEFDNFMNGRWIMTYEDLQDTMMKIVDRTEIDIKNLIEQYNEKARKGQIKTIDNELEDIHEIDDGDLIYAIAGLQAKLESILES